MSLPLGGSGSSEHDRELEETRSQEGVSDAPDAAEASEQARTLVGLAGTVTTLAAMDAGIPAYDARVTHHYRLAATAVHDLAERLLGATRAERAAVPVMHPGRVDVIGAGALVLQVILERTGLPSVLVSEHDILDGIAWSAALQAGGS